jgi:hypothetical protein
VEETVGVTDELLSPHAAKMIDATAKAATRVDLLIVRKRVFVDTHYLPVIEGANIKQQKL